MHETRNGKGLGNRNAAVIVTALSASLVLLWLPIVSAFSGGAQPTGYEPKIEWSVKLSSSGYSQQYGQVISILDDGNIVVGGVRSDGTSSNTFIRKFTPGNMEYWYIQRAGGEKIYNDILSLGGSFYTAGGYKNNTALIQKFNSTTGIEEWGVSWGMPGFDETATSVAPLADGKLLVSGVMYDTGGSGNSKCFLLKIGTDGKPAWSSIWDGGGSVTVIRYALESSDGSLYAAGFWNTATDAAHNLFFAKFNKTGVHVWNKTMGLPGYREMALSMVKDTNSDIFYISGKKETSSTSQCAWIIACDENGTVLWDKLWPNYPVIGYGLADDIAINGTEALYIAGNTPTSAFLAIKYDPDGNLLWNMSWPGSGVCSAYAIAVSPNGEVYITGGTGTSSSTESIAIVKIKQIYTAVPEYPPVILSFVCVVCVSAILPHLARNRKVGI